MAWTFTDDVGTYSAAVGTLLRAEPVRNTVLLSVLAALSSAGPAAFGREPPLLGWWPDAGPVSAAVLQTPPHALLMTAFPEGSAEHLARALADRGCGLSGINGAEQDALVLARAWRDVTGQTGRASQRQRLYRLRRLIQPDPAPVGAPRIASAADASIVRTWYSAFAAEAGTLEVPQAIIEDRLTSSQVMLWETTERPRGGVSGARAPGSTAEPVSLAGMTAVIAGTARIGPVYTPPRSRGRGYGSAVTAAMTEHAGHQGAVSVVLFTDLANPTSNSIYRRLGYEPVEDRVLIAYSSPHAR